MRIPKSILIRPGSNTAYGVVAVALSFFVFAYSIRFGQKAILVYYALWLPLVLVDYRFTLGRMARSPAVLALCLFACLSVFWSAAPGVTLRASIQYLSHVACALIAARVIDARTLSLGAMAGVVLVLVYSVLRPTYAYDAFDGSYTFVGAFASKNMLGFFASLGVFFSAYFGLFLTRSTLSRLAAGLLACSSGAMLLASHSATSILATPLTFSALLVVAGMQKFRPNHRKAFLALGIVLLVASVAVALNLGAVEATLSAFGKDSTLTGRTYLWSEGMKAAEQAPILGQGYQAYWVQGFSEAERLWAEFYIGSRSGFHFHNTYVESLVEIGVVGTAILVVLLGTTLSILVRKLLADSAWTESLLQLGIMMLILIRSFFEVEILQAYLAASFLLYYCAARSREPVRRNAVRAPVLQTQERQAAFGEAGQHA